VGKSDIGKAGWIDISVDDAAGLRDFYANVVGWTPEGVSMGDYEDFTMNTPHGASPVAGLYQPG
jgi:predicted enzyme related to lactoylglutathione lyase